MSADGGLGSHSTASPGPVHGIKRRGGDNNNEQRLSKRFHLLNIGENNSQLWTSPSNTPKLPHGSKEQSNPAGMEIDDTKDRIYVHDLEKELESIDDVSDEDKVIFLPDVERKLNKIPRGLLAGEEKTPVIGNEIVLYSVPASLTVPEEQDSVKKAILESRARASHKAIQDAIWPEEDRQDRFEMQPTTPLTGTQSSIRSNSRNKDLAQEGEDEDAMDIG